MADPYTEAEAAEAREWSNRHGPSNAWTAGNGTAARMIGRLLNERDRLRLTDEERVAIEVAAGDYLYHQDPGGRAQHIRQTLLGLLERTQ
jgi:hypothetical protein